MPIIRAPTLSPQTTPIGPRPPPCRPLLSPRYIGTMQPFDVIIVGAGPAGLAAALALGRARRRVLLCDAGAPRNARAHEVHNFVTRDGTPPADFRRIAREQLAPYASVEVRDARVERIEGERDRFLVELSSGSVAGRRVLLGVGMIDELPELPGYRELWGHAVFQCPYCHGWEVRDGAFGYLSAAAAWMEWSLLLLNWTRDVTVFTGGAYEVAPEVRARLTAAGIAIEERPIASLAARDDRPGALAAVVLADGARVARDVLFARPPQRQTDLVTSLGLALDDHGFVRLDDHRETSRPGVYAAGDLTTMMQGAVLAAAAGTMAAAMINHDLSMAPGA